MKRKITQLRNRFCRLEQELETLKGQPNYHAKTAELLDVFNKLQELETSMNCWTGRGQSAAVAR